MIKKYSCEKDGQVYINKHFQIWEFRSFDDTQGVLTTDDIIIDDNLVENLERLYETLNCSKIIITSGYRSEDFDIRLGGFAGYHSKGQATDIICYDIDGNVIDSKNVCVTAENLGILGIGYGASYTHIDTRDWKSFFDETNGAVNINSWYDYFGIARPEPPKPEIDIQPKEEIKYNIGDVVEINCVYISSTDDNKMEPLITKGTITQVLDGVRNPYLLNDGNIGWVNDDCIIKKCEKQGINVGDKVRVKSPIQYDGEPFYTYYDLYDVIEVNGDRVVIGIDNVVTCAININNIENSEIK